MPTPVATLLYGSLGPVYIAEAVSACRETGQSIPLIVDMLAQVKRHFGYFVLLNFFVHNFDICDTNICRCLSAARASQCQCWRR